MEWFMTVVLGFAKETVTFNSILGIFLYWVPLSFCVFGYTVRTIRNAQKDYKERAAYLAGEYNFYHPTDCLGDLIGRAFVCIIPLANLWVSVIDLGPEYFGKFFEWLGRLFSKPIVPTKDRPQNHK